MVQRCSSHTPSSNRAARHGTKSSEVARVPRACAVDCWLRLRAVPRVLRPQPLLLDSQQQQDFLHAMHAQMLQQTPEHATHSQASIECCKSTQKAVSPLKAKKVISKQWQAASIRHAPLLFQGAVPVSAENAVSCKNYMLGITTTAAQRSTGQGRPRTTEHSPCRAAAVGAPQCIIAY